MYPWGSPCVWGRDCWRSAYTSVSAEVESSSQCRCSKPQDWTTPSYIHQQTQYHHACGRVIYVLHSPTNTVLFVSVEIKHSTVNSDMWWVWNILAWWWEVDCSSSSCGWLHWTSPWIPCHNTYTHYQLKQELIRRWDSERELFNDDIAHT